MNPRDLQGQTTCGCGGDRCGSQAGTRADSVPPSTTHAQDAELVLIALQRQAIQLGIISRDVDLICGRGDDVAQELGETVQETVGGIAGLMVCAIRECKTWIRHVAGRMVCSKITCRGTMWYTPGDTADGRAGWGCDECGQFDPKPIQSLDENEREEWNQPLVRLGQGSYVRDVVAVGTKLDVRA